MNNQKLVELRNVNELLFTDYANRVREYLNNYGVDGSDQLSDLKSMVNYYRGRINALIEVDQILGES